MDVISMAAQSPPLYMSTSSEVMHHGLSGKEQRSSIEFGMYPGEPSGPWTVLHVHVGVGIRHVDVLTPSTGTSWASAPKTRQQSPIVA